LTNIFKTKDKVDLRDRLFEIGEQTLKAQGWRVKRERGLGKSSVRRIEQEDKSLLVSIRTSQDQFIAFPPKPNGGGWVTLDEVNVVLAVSVDGNVPPNDALVHWLEAKEMRQRFDRAAKARRAEGYRERPGRGIWLPLYIPDDGKVVRFVGGGAGLDHPEIARVPIKADVSVTRATVPPEPNPLSGALTMNDAKRGLALTFGVPESAIRITIEA